MTGHLARLVAATLLFAVGVWNIAYAIEIATTSQAVAEVGEVKTRLWLAYLAACSIGFERRITGSSSGRGRSSSA